MSDYMQVLGDIVRSACLERGLTQNDVADHIDVDTRIVLKIENHKGNPKMEVLFPLIRELQIDPNMIFYPELQHDNECLSQFQHFLSQCSDEEIQALLPICEAVLSVLRASKSIHITGE